MKANTRSRPLRMLGALASHRTMMLNTEAPLNGGALFRFVARELFMKSHTTKLKNALIALGGLVVIAYLGNFYYAVHTDQNGGSFGDTFGAANALFSGGALVMLIYAIILQRDELALIEEERNDTRELLKGQNGINVQQKSALNRQIFEQTFGNMLTTALQEKQRLTYKPIIDGKEKSSAYFNSGLFSSRILAKLDSEHSDEIKSGEKELASANFAFINMLVSIDSLIETGCEDSDRQAALRLLLSAMFDEASAYCLAWYIAQGRIDETPIAHLVRPFERFGLIEKLGQNKRTGYCYAMNLSTGSA